MEVNEKVIDNIISYFSESKIIEVFKNEFLQELKNDTTFQEKLKEMLESDEEAPGDEVLWKKIIESDPDLLSQEMKEKLFHRFEDILRKIFQTKDTS